MNLYHLFPRVLLTVLNQYSLNNRFNWKRDRWINFSFGLSGIFYDIQPGSRDPWGPESIVEPLILDDERAMEGSLYIQNEQTINSWLKLSYGLRYSAYGYLGPAVIYDYNEGVTRSTEFIKGYDYVFQGRTDLFLFRA